VSDASLTPTSEGSLTRFIADYVERLQEVIADLPLDRIEQIGEIIYRAYENRKQLFIIGNGGSAATASHMACDMAKNTITAHAPRFRILSLTDNTPLLSALANDVGYEHVFTEQLVNLVQPGDVLVALSASGNSPNVVGAMHYARERGATIIALLGFDGGRAAKLADECVVVPSRDYGIVEDIHLILNHTLVGYFQRRLKGYEPSFGR
jgi:D-sedoheptulose 7-phosphate isomerase